MTRKIVASLLLVCTSIFSYATTYYVSHNGNDTNSGTSQSQPWRNISRISQVIYTLEPGDQILFERGGIYPGKLDIPRSGTSSQPIVVGAYGSGDQPIISGGVPVTNWVQHSGNIWRASLTTSPKYVMVNNQLMQLARFPNSGWLRNEQGSMTQINCSDLNQSSGHWTGATAIIRTTNYSYEKGAITSSNNGSINFTGVVTNLQEDDWGFFIEGKLSELDMAGEWYHDAPSGQLYLWAPNNSNPNSMSVYASIYDKGIVPGWQRSHMLIQDLTVQGQTSAGISTDVANNVTVQNCTIRYCYIGISSSGHDNQYINNTFDNTFASAMNIYDQNTLVEGNVFTDIAIRAGMGQEFWGYWAVNATGSGTIIRDNRITNVGYIGICVGNNVLVENNVVKNATSILNDGAGIAFDNCNGATIRDNIVIDCIGNLESVATSHNVFYPICFGIYFGNTNIQNTTVEGNTVARCNGAGIHVDHTMVSSGNQVKDNVLFDNNVQLSLSDFSNSNGPGATYPYYVANYNTVYSGNVMYSLRPEQLCMRIYETNSSSPTDFGSFSNNKYFHPFEELSIMKRNSGAASQLYYTLERWQSTFNEDAGSTRSPLRLSKYATASELSNNLITNGDFSDDVTDWTIFPGNGEAVIDHDFLDDGSLKANLPNNSLYNSMNLRSPFQFSMQNGQWYRMRLSVQSDIQGIMTTGVKGLSQISTSNTIGKKDIPFSTERRDLEFYFYSELSDQALLQLVNPYEYQRYWIDNVELHRVTVQELDPTEDHVLFHNEFSVAQNFSLPSGCWADINGVVLNGDVTVQPFSSKVIYRVPGTGCGAPVTAHTVGARAMLGGALTANGTMRTDLLESDLIPMSEPYSAMGFDLANAGQQVSSSVLAGTGNDAIVDWIVLELRNSDGSHSAVERRAALVRADGDVVGPDGSSQITFSVATQGKHLAIKHRNHLAIMTASPIGSNGQVIDLTTSNTLTYGSGARMYNGNYRAMWPGDVNGDGMISYTNAENDRDEILVAIGSVVPSQTTTGYDPEDVNMDGTTKYTGALNDRDIILTAIGGTVPTAVRLAQMP